MNGYTHHAPLRAFNHDSGVTTIYRVHWTPETVECCGDEYIVAGRQFPPVWAEAECGTVHPHAARCRKCGNVYSAGFVAEVVKRG